MNACGSLPGDPNAAYPIQSVEQRHHVARRRRFWSVTQPGEAGASYG